MKITRDWLEGKQVCGSGLIWFKHQTETNSIKLIQRLIKEDHIYWASWLLFKVMSYMECLSCAIYAADSALVAHSLCYRANDKIIRRNKIFKHGLNLLSLKNERI